MRCRKYAGSVRLPSARRHQPRRRRIIARPFVGAPGAFQRTSTGGTSLTPFSPACWTCSTAGTPVVAIGKSETAARGMRAAATTSDAHGLDESSVRSTPPRGLIFANQSTGTVRSSSVEDYAANLKTLRCEISRAHRMATPTSLIMPTIAAIKRLLARTLARAHAAAGIRTSVNAPAIWGRVRPSRILGRRWLSCLESVR